MTTCYNHRSNARGRTRRTDADRAEYTSHAGSGKHLAIRTQLRKRKSNITMLLFTRSKQKIFELRTTADTVDVHLTLESAFRYGQEVATPCRFQKFLWKAIGSTRFTIRFCGVMIPRAAVSIYFGLEHKRLGNPSPALSALGLHITWGLDEINTQISKVTLGNHGNP